MQLARALGQVGGVSSVMGRAVYSVTCLYQCSLMAVHVRLGIMIQYCILYSVSPGPVCPSDGPWRLSLSSFVLCTWKMPRLLRVLPAALEQPRLQGASSFHWRRVLETEIAAPGPSAARWLLCFMIGRPCSLELIWQH